MSKRLAVVWELGILGLLLAGVARAGDDPAANWSRWRGPSSQGYSADTRVPLTWSETQNLLWKTALPGVGASSPVVWGDRLFVTAASRDGKERSVICLRTTDGKILWHHVAARDAHPAQTHQWNGYASPSCTTDGKRVYAFFGTPGLLCYDIAGHLLWKHQFGVFTSQRGWGIAASPLLFEDLVIQNCDNDGANGLPPGGPAGQIAPMALVALDKATGKLRWTAPRNQGRGFSTPLVIPTPEGRVDLVLNSPLGVWAYDPHTGKEIWHCERYGEGPPDNNSGRFGEPMPAFDQDTLYGTSGRPGPFQAIRMGGSGNVSGTHRRWEVVRKGHRDVASPVLWKGLLYVADSKGMLTCHDAATGAVVYDKRVGTKVLASLIIIRDKLLVVLEDGQALIVEPGREFKVINRNKLGEGGELDFSASPAVADGRLFLRSQSYVYCIGEQASSR
jgi:outer membrane protein assembly factor BamB